MRLKKFAILLGIIFWPLSLFLNNTLPNFIKYIFPLFEPKLVLFPLILFALKKNLKLFLLFLVIFMFSFKSFWGQTVFKPDYEAEQSVIRQTLLYPNVFLARAFHNKARIYIDKFNNNFFALTDPNNYFFRFAPRQITVDNQNLKKYPSLALFVVIFGFYTLPKSKYKNLILIWLFAGVVSLSVLGVFDRHDFILWFPLSAIFIHGVNQIKDNKFSKIFLFVFILLSLLELAQIIV